MVKINQSILSKAVDKMSRNTLDIEDILDEEDLIQEMKGSAFSQIMNL